MGTPSSLFALVGRRLERLDGNDDESHEFSLALLRILVPPFMLLAPGFRESVRVASWDHARWAVPEGLGWFVRHVPIHPGLALAAQVIAALAAFHAMLGFRARPALAVLAVSGFYLYAIAQLTGFVWHDMHLLWMAALLSVSPCDKRLALDAARPNTGPSGALAVWFVRLLLSVIYFFPGLHKLLTSGLAWALGDNLLNQLYWKWLQHGSPPVLRLDRTPWLLAAGGLFTLTFELGFPLLMFTRTTRALAAALGIVFHALAIVVFRISFPSLCICYVVLVDWRRFMHGFGGRIATEGRRAATISSAPMGTSSPADASAAARDVSARLLVVGSMLVVGAVVQGVRGRMASYPFACYPTFQWLTPDEMPDLTIELVSAEGNAREVVHARDGRGYRTQRQWGEVFRLAGVTGSVDRARLRAYFASVWRSSGGGAAHFDDAVAVRFSRVYRSVRPEDAGKPPTRRELLWEAPIARGSATPTVSSPHRIADSGLSPNTSITGAGDAGFVEPMP